MEGDEEPSFNEEQAPPQAAVFANGDNASRDRHDTSTSNASEEWKTKSANDLLVDLLDPVSDRSSFRNFKTLFNVNFKTKCSE